ncbi:helix-turn-helix transcriptional regulator [Chitiniphilus eburneus]|uniref:Helix-turn-helix transcriptional regulator n=1 Tax=Chitiniphilus eburneus TaxID=2571148 RepID=A0A4U0PX85_9NEIS|nr:helix-turn-helix transcriptional regulator [Chitiniphilus eburneus]TJZ73149.1 helix-turn-helix transcriptional regulator [Chitiniphilus eburneus]
MSAIGERLKIERLRLGMSQEDFAAKAGVSRRTQTNYETGERVPDAALLAAVALLGVDIQFVVLGLRHPAQLSSEQNDILDAYAAASPPVRGAALAALRSESTPLAPPPTSRLDPQSAILHGEVEQVRKKG